MRVELKTDDVNVSEGLKPRIERRIREALARFGTRIGRVVVFLRDLDGPEEGIDKSVRILARVEGVGLVGALVVDSDWRIAVDRAADRIGRNVAREVIRHRRRWGTDAPGSVTPRLARGG